MSMEWDHSNYTRGYDESEGNGNSMSSITFTSQSLSQHFPQPRRAIKLDSLPPSLSQDSTKSSLSSSPSHTPLPVQNQEYQDRIELPLRQELSVANEEKQYVTRKTSNSPEPFYTTNSVHQEPFHASRSINESKMKVQQNKDASHVMSQELHVINTHHSSASQPLQAHTTQKLNDKSNCCYYPHHQQEENNYNLITNHERQQQQEKRQERVPFRVRDFNVSTDSNIYTGKKVTGINSRCNVVNNNIQQMYHHHHHYNRTDVNNFKDTLIKNTFTSDSRDALDDSSLSEAKEINVHIMQDSTKLANMEESKERTSLNIVDNEKYVSTYTCTSNTAKEHESSKHKLLERYERDDVESYTLRFPFTRALSLNSSPSPTPLHSSLEKSNKRSEKYHSSLSSQSTSENEETDQHMEDNENSYTINNDDDDDDEEEDENSTYDNVYDYSNNDLEDVHCIDNSKCIMSRSTSPPPKITDMESNTISSVSVNTRRRYSCTLSEGMCSVSATGEDHMNDDDDDNNSNTTKQHLSTHVKKDNTVLSTSFNLITTRKVDQDDMIDKYNNNEEGRNDRDEVMNSYKPQNKYSGFNQARSSNAYCNESATPPPRRAFVLSSHDISLEMSNSHAESQHGINNVDDELPTSKSNANFDTRNALIDKNEHNTESSVNSTFCAPIIDKDSGKDSNQQVQEKIAQVNEDAFERSVLEQANDVNEMNVLTQQSPQTESESSLVIECAIHPPSVNETIDEHLQQQERQEDKRNRYWSENSFVPTQEMNMNSISHNDTVNEALNMEKRVEQMTCTPLHDNNVSTKTNIKNTFNMNFHEKHLSTLPLLPPETSPLSLSLSESLMLVNGGTPTPLRAWRNNFIKEERNIIVKDKANVLRNAEHECVNDNAKSTCILHNKDIDCTECNSGSDDCVHNVNACQSNNKSSHYLGLKDLLVEDVGVTKQSNMHKTERSPSRSVSLVFTGNKLFSDKLVKTTMAISKNNISLHSSKSNNHWNLDSVVSNSTANNVKRENANCNNVEWEQEHNVEKAMIGNKLTQHSYFLTNEPRVSVEVRELVERAEEKIRRSRQSLLLTMQRLENNHEQKEKEKSCNVQASLQEEKRELSQEWKHLELPEEQQKTKRVKCESLHIVEERDVNENKSPSTSVHEENIKEANVLNLQHTNVFTIVDVNSCKEVWNSNVLHNKVHSIIASRGNVQHWTAEELQKELAENAKTILNNFTLLDKVNCGVLPMEIILCVIYITLRHDIQSKNENDRQVETHTSKGQYTLERENSSLSYNAHTNESTHQLILENKNHTTSSDRKYNVFDLASSHFSSTCYNMHEFVNHREEEEEWEEHPISQSRGFKRNRCELSTRESPTRTLENVMSAQANMKSRQTLEELYCCILEVFKCAFGECYALAHLGASNCSSFEVLQYVQNSTNTTIATDKQNALSNTCEKENNTNALDCNINNELWVRLLSTFPRLSQPYALTRNDQHSSDNVDNSNDNLAVDSLTSYNNYESKIKRNGYVKSVIHENSSHKFATDKFPWPLTCNARLKLTQPPPLDMLVHYRTFANSLHDLIEK